MADIRARSLGGYQVLLQTDEHSVLADEPKGVGNGLGLDPYELLLSALGACTVMTLEIYAKRKEWPLEQVDAKLFRERVHARDCEECEQETGFVDRIHVRLDLKGDLDTQQRQRLLEIADRCPVRRTLANAPKITHELTGQE